MEKQKKLSIIEIRYWPFEGVIGMKKAMIYVMACLFAASFFGCSSRSSKESSQSTTQSSQSSAVSELPSASQAKPADQLQQQLANQGWAVKEINAGELGLSDVPNIVYAFGAKNPDGMIMYGTWFLVEDDARKNFDTLVPDDASAVREDGQNYQEAFITLPGTDGVWMIRQIGGCVFGLWAPEGISKPTMESTLNSF